MEEGPINEFRELLISTTYPPLEVATTISVKKEFEATFKDKIEEHLKPIIDRLNTLDAFFIEMSSEIKTLKAKINAVEAAKPNSQSEKRILENEALTDTTSQLDRADDTSTIVVHTNGMSPALHLEHFTEKLSFTASSVDRMDKKVDRLDTKVDRYDIKVDQMDSKINELDKQVGRYDQKLEEYHHDMVELKKEVEKLEKDL